MASKPKAPYIGSTGVSRYPNLRAYGLSNETRGAREVQQKLDELHKLANRASELQIEATAKRREAAELRETLPQQRAQYLRGVIKDEPQADLAGQLEREADELDTDARAHEIASAHTESDLYDLVAGGALADLAEKIKAEGRDRAQRIRALAAELEVEQRGLNTQAALYAWARGLSDTLHFQPDPPHSLPEDWHSRSGNAGLEFESMPTRGQVTSHTALSPM